MRGVTSRAVVVLTLLAAAFAAVGAAEEPSLTGVWTGQLPGRNNTFTDIAFRIVQNGTAVSGKLYGDYISYRIVEGKFEAGRIDFVVVSAEQRGNEINEARFRFSGPVKDGEMELTRERLAVVKAASGEAVTVRNDTKPVFKLKRLGSQ